MITFSTADLEKSRGAVHQSSETDCDPLGRARNEKEVQASRDESEASTTAPSRPTNFIFLGLAALVGGVLGATVMAVSGRRAARKASTRSHKASSKSIRSRKASQKSNQKAAPVPHRAAH